MPYGRALHEQGAALLLWKAVLARASCGVHFVSRLARVAHLFAPLRLLSLGGGATRPLNARAAPRRLWSLQAIWKGTARARGRPSSVQGRAPTCQLQRPLRKPACACSALVRDVAGFSLGRRRAMRACRARAPCRAGCGRSTPYERALHEREAALVRWKAVLPRARHNRLRRPLACEARLCATALPLFGEAAQHVCLPHARAANCAGCGHCMPYGRALH